MMDEYIRLTNMAFSVGPDTDMHNTPPVFLFDEVQKLCVPTDNISIYDSSASRYHTLLTLILINISTKHQPICICTGTNNGEILSITEGSSIVPQVLSLTPLVQHYWN